MKKLSIFLLFLFLTTDAMAAYVAVLETMADGDAKDSVSLLDRQYLTNVLREQAVKELPANDVNPGFKDASLGYSQEYYGLSVRCVKD